MAVKFKGIESELEARGPTCSYEDAGEVSKINKTQFLVRLK